MKGKIHTQNILLNVIAVLIILILCCFNIYKSDYIAVLNDEFGYWANAASVVGYDWRDLISETPYYAWGYSIWLIPIIALLPTYQLWYKAAIVMNAAFLIASYFICKKIANKIFPNMNGKLISIVSLIVILYPSNIVYAQVAWSETLLYFLTWVVTYLIINLEDYFSIKKFIGTILILGYMYIVHARTIGIVAIGAICLLLTLVKHKKNILYLFVIIIFLSGGYFINSIVKDYQLTQLWGNSTFSQMNNVGLNINTISTYVNRLLQAFTLFFESLGGKMVCLTISTGLILPIAFVKLLQQTIDNLRERTLFKNYYICKVWCVFCFVSALGLCALQMVYWTSRKDIIVYSRYIENALGPILLLCILYSINAIKSIRAAVFISALIILLGLRSVYWRVLEAEGYFNTICSPVIGAFYDATDNIQAAFKYIMLVCFVFLAVLFLLTFLRNTYIKYSILISVFACYFVVITIFGTQYVSDFRDKRDKEIVPVKEQINNQYLSNEIYYIKDEERDSSSANPKYLQFMLPDKSIHVITATDVNDLQDNVLILTNPNDEDTIEYLNQQKSIDEVITTKMLKLYYKERVE